MDSRQALTCPGKPCPGQASEQPLLTHPTADPSSSPAPPEWAHAVVITSIHCRGCGYDLQGLSADTRCPECGMSLWDSIVHTVDPDASRLPRLRNPMAVGNALLMLTVCMFLGMLMLIAWPLAAWIDEAIANPRQRFSDQVPSSLSWGSCLIAFGGLWAVWLLKPPRGREPSVTVWLDMWLLTVGWLGWAICATLWSDAIAQEFGLRRQFLLQLCTSMTAIVCLVGLRGALGVVGKRSREYRRSRGGRQGVEALIGAIAGAVLGQAIRHLSIDGALPRGWDSIGQTIVWICAFMIVIGLGYLMVNAWWIRRALRRPPPPMDTVLLPVVPPDTWIPDREE